MSIIERLKENKVDRFMQITRDNYASTQKMINQML